MIIKIDKKKVVEAAEKALHVKPYIKRKNVKYDEFYCDNVTVKVEEVGEPPERLKTIIKMCNLTEERTVTITDEDVELLGL